MLDACKSPRTLLTGAVLLLAASLPVAAEVQVDDAEGFVIHREIVINAAPETVYAAFDGDVSE